MNKFEFPNDSPEEEIKRILLIAGLTEYEVSFLLSCYKVELIENILSGLKDDYYKAIQH